MINTSITLGPFTIPMKLILFIGAALAAHIVLFILKRKDRDAFKKASDLFFNSVILFFIGWRLSLIITNWSTFRGAPTALLYLPGGLLNHLAGAVLAILTLFILYKRRKYSLPEMLGLSILTTGTLALYFILTVFFSLIPSKSQLPEIGRIVDEDKPAVEQSSDSEITLLNIEGEEQPLELTGSPVTIVNFWASWCPPCRAEIPEIARFYAAHKDKDIRLITVNMTSTEKSLEEVMDFIEEENADFPVLLDHKGEAAAYFNINSVPSTFVFNSSGELIKQRSGAVDYAWLQNVSK
jgi:thiol-disulfide isomerase/thioredoxin